jgi:hypothetical protein
VPGLEGFSKVLQPPAVIETVGTYKGQHAKTETDGATKFQRALKIVCAVTHYGSIVSNHLNKIVSKS